jgi:hypothetical protein
MLGVLLIAGSESDFSSNILMQFIMLMRPDPMRFDIQSINTLKQMMMPSRVACINETSEQTHLTGEVTF